MDRQSFQLYARQCNGPSGAVPGTRRRSGDVARARLCHGTSPLSSLKGEGWISAGRAQSVNKFKSCAFQPQKCRHMLMKSCCVHVHVPHANLDGGSGAESGQEARYISMWPFRNLVSLEKLHMLS